MIAQVKIDAEARCNWRKNSGKSRTKRKEQNTGIATRAAQPKEKTKCNQQTSERRKQALKQNWKSWKLARLRSKSFSKDQSRDPQFTITNRELAGANGNERRLQNVTTMCKSATNKAKAVVGHRNYRANQSSQRTVATRKLHEPKTTQTNKTLQPTHKTQKHTICDGLQFGDCNTESTAHDKLRQP